MFTAESTGRNERYRLQSGADAPAISPEASHLGRQPECRIRNAKQVSYEASEADSTAYTTGRLEDRPHLQSMIKAASRLDPLTPNSLSIAGGHTGIRNRRSHRLDDQAGFYIPGSQTLRERPRSRL